MWLKELKIALIEKNIDKLDELMENLPELNKAEDIEKALSLIAEAKSLVQGLRDNTFFAMQKIQKNINFLKSTQAPLTSKLDINS